MKIGQYCQRQRCKHVELEQFWLAFTSRGFVSDSWAFLLPLQMSLQYVAVVRTIGFIVYSPLGLDVRQYTVIIC